MQEAKTAAAHPKVANADRQVAPSMGIWLAALCALTCAVYFAGLSGPYLLDDVGNLRPIGEWLAGNQPWQQVLLGNGSGLFHRPLSMLSFMLDARLFGDSPFPYKATNLLIHLGCGVLIFQLCQRVFERDLRLSAKAPWWALAITAVWLLHPMQASTVLYIVQRMAQLSAAFVLIALLCYLNGRTLLESGPSRAAIAWLFVAFPLATLAAALSKENGVLAPLFALVFEIAYFRGARTPRIAQVFFLTFLLVPGLVIGTWFALHPAMILSGYESREFTFSERLLTEPRVLFDYLNALLLPRGAALGLYGDDFVLSTGWLAPVSTLLAIAFWLGAMTSAWLLRWRSPTFFAGVFLFLAGHVMESSVFALQIYFEHRNYLPSLGVFMAVAGLLSMLAARIPATVDLARIARIAVPTLVLALAGATTVRALAWRTWPGVVNDAVGMHPDSLRAQLDRSVLFVRTAQYEKARAVYAKLRASDATDARNLGAIYPVVIDCMIEGATSTGNVSTLQAVAGRKLGIYEITAMKMLADQLSARECSGFSNEMFATVLHNVAVRAPQYEASQPVVTFRSMAADFFARAGDLAHAREDADAGWGQGHDIGSGLLLVRLLTAAGDFTRADQVLTDVRARIPAYDEHNQQMLAAIAEELRQAKLHADSTAN